MLNFRGRHYVFRFRLLFMYYLFLLYSAIFCLSFLNIIDVCVLNKDFFTVVEINNRGNFHVQLQ